MSSYNLSELQDRIRQELLGRWSPALHIARLISIPHPEHQRIVEQAHQEWKEYVSSLTLDILPYIQKNNITDKKELTRLIVQDLVKQLSPVYNEIMRVYQKSLGSEHKALKEKILAHLLNDKKNKLPKGITKFLLNLMYEDSGEMITPETRAGRENYGPKGLIDPGLISENMSNRRLVTYARKTLPAPVRRVLASYEVAKQHISDYAEIIEEIINQIASSDPTLEKKKQKWQKYYSKARIEKFLDDIFRRYLEKPRDEKEYERIIPNVARIVVNNISNKIDRHLNEILNSTGSEYSEQIATKKQELEARKQEFTANLESKLEQLKQKHDEYISKLNSEFTADMEEKKSRALEYLGGYTKQSEEKINNLIKEDQENQETSRSRLLQSREKFEAKLNPVIKEFFNSVKEDISKEQTQKEQSEKQAEEFKGTEAYTKNVTSTVSSFASSVADKVSNLLLKTYIDYSKNKDYSDDFNKTLFIKLLKEIDWEDSIKSITLSELAKRRNSDLSSFTPELTKKIEQGLFSKLDTSLKEMFRRSQGVPMKTTVFVALIQAARQRASKVIYSYVETLLEILTQTQKEDLTATAFRKARKRYSKVSEPLKSTPDYSGKQLSRLKKKKKSK